MLPIKIAEEKRSVPVVTTILIVVCTFVYLKQYQSVYASGLIPLHFIYSLLHPEQGFVPSLLVLVSSFFLHGSLSHLLGNMWYLWIFGSALEGNLGHKKFVVLYFLFGIVSMLTQVAINPLSTIPVVGASGAIAGIMGMYLVYKPISKLLMWFPPLFFFNVYSILFLLFWFWLQWVNMRSSNNGGGSLIAWWAHIGGFLCGVLCAVVVRASSRK